MNERNSGVSLFTPWMMSQKVFSIPTNFFNALTTQWNIQLQMAHSTSNGTFNMGPKEISVETLTIGL